MPSLPVVSGLEAVKIFQRCGWRFHRQVGSHMILVKEGVPVTLSVPNHREVAKGTLRALISASGLSVSEFLVAAKKH